MDTIGNQNSEVSLTKGLPVYFQYISSRCAMRNRAVEAAFSELFFAVRWQGMLRRG